MPKAVFSLNRFEGGLNNEADIRDILDNEFPVLKNVNIDHIGRVEVIGGVKSISFTISDIDTLTPGYGILVFGADEGFSSNGDLKFIAIAGEDSSGNYICKIYENDGTESGLGIIINSSPSATKKFLPVFYFVDNALRINDGSFDSDNNPQFASQVLRSHFDIEGSGPIDDYQDWFVVNNDLVKPTRGLASNLYSMADSSGGDINTLVDTSQFINWTDAEIDDKGYLAVNIDENVAVKINSRTSDSVVETDDLPVGHDWNNDTYYIFPPAGLGFNIKFDFHSSGGTWPAGDYEFGITFIYDGSQESLVYTLSCVAYTLAAGNYLDISVYATSPFPVRITGGRVYTRIKDSEDDWTFILDIDLLKGSRKKLDGSYKKWEYLNGYSGTPNVYIKTGVHTLENLEAHTYESINGFNPDEVNTLAAEYKTAVVANNICYIGNVKYDGEYFRDSIFKSYVNRFDTFTKNRRLDVAISDGEDIVKFEEYADRLLEFKEKTLYIINVSQEIEFLEDTFKFMGVTKPYHTFRTEFGIAWINKYGVYIYDGKQIHELLKREGLRKISMEEWQSFFSDNSSIGYNPNRKKLIIVKDITSADSDCMLYSFDVGAWVYGDSNFVSQENMSNFSIDWNRKAIFLSDNGGSVTVEEWDDASPSETTKTIEIQTKDFDFGAPGIKANFYGLVISYTGGGAGTSLDVSYAVNGTESWVDFATSLEDETAIQTIVELKPDIRVKNIYSIQFKIAGTAHRDFELNDITIYYRPKGIH